MSVEPTEDKVGFGGVTSLSCFSGAFDESV